MRLTWQDADPIAQRLLEAHPHVDPRTVRFTDLHRWVTELPGFDDDRQRNVERALEQIQARWIEEWG